MPNKIVAIVGSHTLTRMDAPFERGDTDFWVFNEAASLGWAPRVDAVFQIHDRVVWKNPMNRNDPNFRHWLKRKHPYPIYMQKHWRSVPSSVVYPLAEVSAELLPKLRKGEELKRYWTSSVAYALALAVYQQYERIELYGVEMASNTEYTYQREGVFFWLGLALGRGIEVWVHPKSGFFTEPLYGYEGDATLKLSHFEERVELLERLIIKGKAQLEAANQMQRDVLNEAMEESGGEAGMGAVASTKKYFASIKAQVSALIDLGALEGALVEERHYIEKANAMNWAAGGHFFARQEFELNGSHAQDGREQCKAKMHVMGAGATAAWNNLQKGKRDEVDDRRLMELSTEYAEAHKNYLQAAYQYGRVSGAMDENLTLLVMVDELIKAAGGSKAEEAILASLGVDGKQLAVDGRNGKNLTPALPETGREQEKEAVAG